MPRAVGKQIHRVAGLDRDALERDGCRYNVHFILGGQVRGEPHRLYLIYPQGNPLSASDESPYLQIGECKYGRPILDRGIRYHRTSLEEAAKYALISLDSTMRSNTTVGPPIDVALCAANELRITRYRRFGADDPDLRAIRVQWEQALRKSVQELPAVRFDDVKL
jgi:putative proteasome-type protease